MEASRHYLMIEKKTSGIAVDHTYLSKKNKQVTFIEEVESHEVNSPSTPMVEQKLPLS